jgi:hypothetical protein
VFDRKKILAVFLSLSFFVSGCLTVPSAAQRLATADALGEKANFKRVWLRTPPFFLTVYEKIQTPGQPLHVYIEGDGYAWVTRNRVSGNPTPRQPVALELATEDPAANVIYIARPCQYTPTEMDYACEETYWTDKRFSEEVVNAVDQAVDWFVKKAQSPGVELIGYSGGGAVAALIAARRPDVKSLRTVAGNLDPNGLNDYHGVSPLDAESLDPMEVAGKIAAIPQYHFIGADDKVVPALISENFLKKSAPSACVHIMPVEGANHVKGWPENWRYLLALPLDCSEQAPS